MTGTSVNNHHRMIHSLLRVHLPAPVKELRVSWTSNDGVALPIQPMSTSGLRVMDDVLSITRATNNVASYTLHWYSRMVKTP